MGAPRLQGGHVAATVAPGSAWGTVLGHVEERIRIGDHQVEASAAGARRRQLAAAQPKVSVVRSVDPGGDDSSARDVHRGDPAAEPGRRHREHAAAGAQLQ
ncbi:hypothetical protein ACWDE0_35100 [Streptomyces sp. 900105755]